MSGPRSTCGTRVLLALLLSAGAFQATALAQPSGAHSSQPAADTAPPRAPGASPAGPGAGAATGGEDDAPPVDPVLPDEHVPRLNAELTPKSGAKVGDLIELVIRADALDGDDVAVPDQSFAPFEVHAKRSHVVRGNDGRKLHVFELDLLAFEPGRHELPGVELRVVTKLGIVGEVRTQPLAIEVGSLLGNEPNAQLKPETKPVVVMQDDYTLLYLAAAIAAAALIALLTWLVLRYLERRVKPAPPPPPPRPPWEIAATKLADLRRRKSQMVDEGKSAQFVDEVSDVVREYLGGRFGFDGLETTTDEMLSLLRNHNCNSGLAQEVAAYLRRCDLVKFANVEPDRDEADLVFAKAQDIVQFSMPLGEGFTGDEPAQTQTASAERASRGGAASTPAPSARGTNEEGGP